MNCFGVDAQTVNVQKIKMMEQWKSTNKLEEFISNLLYTMIVIFDIICTFDVDIYSQNIKDNPIALCYKLNLSFHRKEIIYFFNTCV